MLPKYTSKARQYVREGWLRSSGGFLRVGYDTGFRRPLHGFTLIELLVVIAIISLLVSILLPSLTKAKELARQVVCSSRLRQMGLGVAYYAQDYDGHLLPALTTGPNGEWYAWTASGWEMELAVALDMDPTPGTYNMPEGDFWLCPQTSSDPDRPWARAYAYNAIGTNDWLPPRSGEKPFRISEFSDPAQTIVITDAWNHVTDWVYSWKPDFAAQSDPRHSGNCNILWLDGHVEALPLEAFNYDVQLWRR